MDIAAYLMDIAILENENMGLWRETTDIAGLIIEERLRYYRRVITLCIELSLRYGFKWAVTVL